ncbi:MAG TPA: flagellar hook-associated protein FlgK [Sphingomonas sp.]|jgi:flagellar hook-associated protein 1 FlgK|uniref:flagellar hook-associated protein FlgK n=1 Tax=Sphingomonas sp. TaxID=28214 RepID=UPI002EDBA6BF
MSDLLSIGASGVRAYQTALTTVSENIANTGVEGYSRRQVALREVQVTGGLASGGMTNGLGVSAAGIVRSSDVYAGEAVRAAASDVSRTEVGAKWLDGIEDALTGDRLSERLTGFFASSRALGAEPASSALRAGMLGAAESAAAAFTATGRAVDQVAADLDTNANQSARDLTQLAGTLAKINLGLGRTQRDTAAAAQLSDQRDQVLEQMSALIDLKANFDAYGRATVRLGGRNGPVMVDAARSGQLSYARAGGAVALTLSFGGEGGVVDPQGGALAGIVDAAQRINDTRRQLDAVATRFATDVNGVQAAGQDVNGVAGRPIFAANGSPTELGVAMTDPSGIAAAGVGGGPRDGTNLNRFEALRTATGAEASATALVTDNATALRQRLAIADAQGAIRDGAVTARASLSGVDLDNEAVDLLRFQQAYQASSRVIQVARETFNSILEIR